MADYKVLLCSFVQELQERIQRAAEAKPSPAADAEIARIQREVVDFHGEMVLLENYSALNYTGEHALLPCSWLQLVVSVCVFLDLKWAKLATWCFFRVEIWNILWYRITCHLYMV